MEKYVVKSQYVNEFVKGLGYNPTGKILDISGEIHPDTSFNGELVDIELLNAFNQNVYLQATIKTEEFKIYHYEDRETPHISDQSQKWILFQIEKDKNAARHLKAWAKKEYETAKNEESAKIDNVKDQYKVRKEYFKYLMDCIDKHHPDDFANAYGNNE